MSSGFISESELAEKRRLRQEEWERVRLPSQPLEVPEEPFDHRTLYERLEEQKQKKQLEFEESHRLKNMIKGLDDDEIEFLDFVDKKKLEAEQLKVLEEKQELMDFRLKVEKLKETSMDQRIQTEIQSLKTNNFNSSSLKSQMQLLKGVIKKKPAFEEDMGKGNKVSTEEDIDNTGNTTAKKRKLSDEKKKDEATPGTNTFGQKYSILESGLTCVGILPGLCSYVESSDDSDHTSSSSETNDDKKYDLTGRRIIYKSKGDPESQ